MTEQTASAPDAPNQLQSGQEVSGTVKSLGLYGALVDIGAEQDALLHISQIGQPDILNIEKAYNVGDAVTAYVLKVNSDGLVALTIVKPPDVPISTIRTGTAYTGEVIRIEQYGIFVDIGAERPGMVHVSEMADGYVKSPGDVVSIGDTVEVRVLKLNRKKQQIDLSMKSEVPEEVIDDTEEEDEAIPTAMAEAFRKAMANSDDESDEETPAPQPRGSHRNQQDEILSRTLRDQES